MSCHSTPTIVHSGVTVRFFDLDRITVEESLLSENERDRVARKGTPTLRQRQAASFVCLRRSLGEVLGLRADRVPIRIAPGGKPHVEGQALCFNLSHSANVGMLAWSDREIGADVEALIAKPTDALAEEILSADEWGRWRALPPDHRQAWLTRAWCRKESALKAVGAGLRIPPRTLDVGGGDPAGEGWSIEIEGRVWHGVDVGADVPVGFLAAICVEAGDG